MKIDDEYDSLDYEKLEKFVIDNKIDQYDLLSYHMAKCDIFTNP
jgi:hypothetical protein